MPILAMIIAFGTTEALRPSRIATLAPMAWMPAASAPAAPPGLRAPPPLAALRAPAPQGSVGPGDIEARPVGELSYLSNHAGPLLAPVPPASGVMESAPAPALSPATAAPALTDLAPGSLAETGNTGARASGPLKVAALAPPLPPEAMTAPLPPAEAMPAYDDGTNQCDAPEGLLLTAAERSDPRRLPPVPRPEDIGSALAAAAHRQVSDLVVYDDRYRRISYPMGDVSTLYGVCTDVIIRAYRVIGIDLQHEVQASGLGSGDPSIDHRRTETLRRFFTRFGESLPVTSVPEDYRPGDIVTYYRPQNTASRSHIAIVSDVMAASGRYMIIHNRGWGPQLEDGLFVDEITGHYRYRGTGAQTPAPAMAIAADEATARPAARSAAAACPTSAGRHARQPCVAPRIAKTARIEGQPVRGLGR